MSALLGVVAYAVLTGPILIALVWGRVPTSQRIYVRRGH